MRYLKDLDSTIADIEAENKKNADPFLLFTLNRLKIYRDNGINKFERRQINHNNEKNKIRGGFKGVGVC